MARFFNQMLAEPYMSSFREKTIEFEGRTNFLYADTHGNPTVGIGHLCATAQDAETLLFSGDAARDWQIIKDAPPGRIAAFYEALTESRLSDAAIDSVFEKDCDTAWNAMKSFIPEIDSLPQTVAIACLDMSFNLGGEKFHADFFGPHSKFGPAIARGAWQTAAAECIRTGISPSRNAYTQALIMSAFSSTAIS